MKHIAIIGGGITGLAAAFTISKIIKEQELSLSFSLMEADSRLGGKIKTTYTEGFIIERGSDSFLARKKGAAQLVKDVGLGQDLVRNRTGQAYVLNDERLYPIPKGAVMGIPTSFSAFMLNDMFSFTAKCRTAMDLILPRSTNDGDLSIGNFFRHRFGNETVERLIEPLLSGIYAGDLDRLSLMATFPQFKKVEMNARSLLIGMRKNQAKTSSKEKSKGQFLTLKNGLASLVDAVESQLPESSIFKNSAVERLTKTENGYTLQLKDRGIVQADAVISTVPHEVSQHFLPRYSFLQSLHDARPTTVATVAMAFPESAVKFDHDGTGFVVSRTAGFTITACTWTHKKWPHTTPEGKVLLRCYVGKPGDDAIVNLSDEEIIDIVMRDLRRVMHISKDPEFFHVFRWYKAMPQYMVGHLQWLENLRKQAALHLPGLFFAGASYEGVGLPDCIDQGRRAAGDAIRFMK